MNVTLSDLLKKMLDMAGSDLHITTNSPPQVRVHGHLQPLDMPPLTPSETKQLAYSVLTDAQKHRFEENLELDFSFGLKGLARFRGNCFNQRGAVGAVYRVIPFEIKTFQQLNLPAIISKLCDKPRGLILVTGPTGSGKSTTLAAMVDSVNRREQGHIITLEDPIEYAFVSNKCAIEQREVGSDVPSFSSGLRHVLRQDPDTILVGEMRDLETTSAAITAAETGHLVFSTLHTTDATQTLNRIISFYPPYQHQEIRMLLATALQAVVSLRLVPRADGRGRVPAAEVLVNTAAVADNIRDIEKALNIPDLIAEGTVSYGMQSFDQSLMKWFKDGMISYESALFYSTNPSEFALRVSGVDSASDRKFSEISGDASAPRALDLTP